MAMKQRETELILQAARLYYEEEFSQDEVAKKLNTSRSNISRMLTAARRLGYVEIRVIAPTSRHDYVAQQLIEKLGIEDIQVIAPDRNDLALNAVGRAAAQTLQKGLKANQTIAISWGRGLEATVVNCRKDSIPGLKVTQLMGSMSNVMTSVSAEEVGRTLARNLNAEFLPFSAPVIVSNPKTRDSLIQEPAVDRALEAARKADVALVGIGSNGSSSSEMLIEEFALTKGERDATFKNMAGDIAARFYNAQGKILSAAIDNRVIGLTLDEIRKIPKVIGVATGADKVLGVIGAARSKLVDHLIIDLTCANAALKYLAASEARSA
jgi:DNA-binding transcriptional regulator LsrR (DeoR family)